MPENAAMGFVREWWSVIVFAMSTFAAYIVGRERTRYRISDLMDEVHDLKAEVATLKGDVKDLAGTMAVVGTDVKWLREMRK